jgi:hypothetical protein
MCVCVRVCTCVYVRACVAEPLWGRVGCPVQVQGHHPSFLEFHSLHHWCMPHNEVERHATTHKAPNLLLVACGTAQVSACSRWRSSVPNSLDDRVVDTIGAAITNTAAGIVIVVVIVSVSVVVVVHRIRRDNVGEDPFLCVL